MFCKNCGTELSEKAKFCTQCGKNINEEQTVMKTIVISRKKWLLPILALALLIVIVFVLYKSNDINSSPEKVAAATLKSEYEADIDTMMDCFPDFFIKELAADKGLSPNSDPSVVEKAIEEDYRNVTPQEVEILSTELVREYTIEEYTIYRELYDYLTDEEYNSITKIAQVNVEFRIDDKVKTKQLTCIEIDNNWYYLRELQ